jgi:hypothetical protein
LRKLNCEVRLCLDGDAPGPGGHDENDHASSTVPASPSGWSPTRAISAIPTIFLQESGPEALKTSMNHLVDAFDFQVDYYTNVKKLDSPEEKRKVMMYFIPFLQERSRRDRSR